MIIDDRVICSTITLRHLPLAAALAAINAQGFKEIDLGALPGVCDHVPYVLDDQAVAAVAKTVNESGLLVRTVNGDVGDLNNPLAPAEAQKRADHVHKLLELCVAIGAAALVLPNGRQSHDPIGTLDEDLDEVARSLTQIATESELRGVELWVEAPHWFRLAYDLDRTATLLSRLPENIGIVCDVSHITAGGSTPRQFLELFGVRTKHVHIRDAEPNYIHHSVGRGIVDFPDLIAALDQAQYTGALALELETRDTEDNDRAREAQRAGVYLSSLFLEASNPIETKTETGARR